MRLLTASLLFLLQGISAQAQNCTIYILAGGAQQNGLVCSRHGKGVENILAQQCVVNAHLSILLWETGSTPKGVNRIAIAVGVRGEPHPYGDSDSQISRTRLQMNAVELP